MVTPIWFETRGPHEAPPDDAFEWARTGRRADAGRRRYSAYASMNNRDGPRMMPGLHPSRSALRPMAPTPIRYTTFCLVAQDLATQSAPYSRTAVLHAAAH
jgi:hypothetical protein